MFTVKLRSYSFLLDAVELIPFTWDYCYTLSVSLTVPVKSIITHHYFCSYNNLFSIHVISYTELIIILTYVGACKYKVNVTMLFLVAIAILYQSILVNLS